MAKRNCVGVIGLGRMGNPVAQRFIGAKMPLMVWDVSEERRGPFEEADGVTIATPREIGESCAVVFFVVPSSEEIAACFKGKDGLLKNPKKGLVVYDLTTSDPAKTKRLAKRAERAGLGYLDAGMSGGPGNILEGKLTLIIGGDEKLLKRTRRYLKPFVDHVFHLGALGSGHTMKLIHNMVLHTMFLATCEGARLVERLGMRVEDMIDIFNASAAYSYASRHRFPEQHPLGHLERAGAHLQPAEGRRSRRGHRTKTRRRHPACRGHALVSEEGRRAGDDRRRPDASLPRFRPDSEDGRARVVQRRAVFASRMRFDAKRSLKVEYARLRIGAEIQFYTKRKTHPQRLVYRRSCEPAGF